jgi:hypothetical protein
MLAANVNRDGEGKFDEDEQSAVTPNLASIISGFDCHPDKPLRGNTLAIGEKSQRGRELLAQSFQRHKSCERKALR